MFFAILVACLVPSMALSQQNGAAFPPTPQGQPDILLAGSDNRSFNLAFRDRLSAAFSRSIRIGPYTPDASRRLPDTLVVALGSAAVNEVMQQEPRPPLLALMVSNHQVEQYAGLGGAPFSALFHNPPLKRQALLGQQVLPHAATVSVLARPGEEHSYHELADELDAYGLELRVFTVKSSANLVATLNRALSFGDFLLGTPDPEIYNRQTIKHILLTTYRHNRILIGPERAFVQAGALASTFTPTEIIIENAASIIEQYLKQGDLPQTGYPEQFSVAFNQQVARSLNIPLPDRDVIVENLRALDAQKTGVGND
ncbi:ABC transporter substrate-binding protein [Marinobacter nanhaiticus D15-8W]|uniref:ABC transporter substrate-binding protein n=2 Tax=Marinobacter TaxID=2742 RepID=N6WQR8_9GAMM|nr:ABC transporter substrate-binding protein [Marinobacter nanhaiticus D15-8W]